MTDILQKVLYYVRQKQTACTLVVSSRHNIERYAFPVLYTAKKRSKKSRQANTGTIQNFYFSFLCVSISNKNIISIILISDIMQDLTLHFVWWVENDIRE